jgi:hypothetical protein
MSGAVFVGLFVATRLGRRVGESDTISARGGLQKPHAIGVYFGKVGPVRFFDDSPRRVNKRMMRVMILRSTASSSSVEGAATRGRPPHRRGLGRRRRAPGNADEYSNSAAELKRWMSVTAPVSARHAGGDNAFTHRRRKVAPRVASIEFHDVHGTLLPR